MALRLMREVKGIFAKAETLTILQARPFGDDVKSGAKEIRTLTDYYLSDSILDFQEIDAASSRGVDDTKQLLETVMHMPSSSRYKVYLLDEVHMLSTQSFNMLLKTLEEPPEHVIFILATTLPEKYQQQFFQGACNLILRI